MAGQHHAHAASPATVHTGGRHRPHLPRVACLLLGLAFTTVGAIGIAEGGVDTMQNVPATVSAPTVAGFGGSPFLNFAHLTYGLLALAASATRRGPRLVGTVGLVALAATVAYDVVALTVGLPGEPLSVHWPALVLHVAGWLLALVIVASEFRAATRAGEEPNLSLTTW